MTEQPDLQTHFDHFLSDRKAERWRLFGAESPLHLIDVFDQRFQACTGFKIESAAELITSAWVDEHSGISGSISALRNWFTDVERFSKESIVNVHELLVELDAAHGQTT